MARSERDPSNLLKLLADPGRVRILWLLSQSELAVHELQALLEWGQSRLSTQLGQPVVIDNKPSAYARVEGFEPDRKPGWWQIHLLLLTIPLQRVVWILKEEYFNGTPFTMQGTPMLLEPLPQPAIEKPLRRT